jgi:hypothetical protein
MRQHNQLGAGFRIAMRDLELRGAGNLLGSEQSGHIVGVGFELYCQLLRQSVARLKGEKTIRVELQNLTTRQDKQDWAQALVEYTFNTHWFAAVQDQYNYGNTISTERYHYYNATVGYIKGASRITLGYGKQRAGIFCVGGICRQVPASNGITLSVTTSF